MKKWILRVGRYIIFNFFLYFNNMCFMGSLRHNNRSFFLEVLFFLSIVWGEGMHFCVTCVFFHNSIPKYLTNFHSFTFCNVIESLLHTFHASFRFSISGISQHFLCSANTFTCLPPPAFLTNYTRRTCVTAVYVLLLSIIF